MGIRGMAVHPILDCKSTGAKQKVPSQAVDAGPRLEPTFIDHNTARHMTLSVMRDPGSAPSQSYDAMIFSLPRRSVPAFSPSGPTLCPRRENSTSETPETAEPEIPSKLTSSPASAHSSSRLSAIHLHPDTPLCHRPFLCPCPGLHSFPTAPRDLHDPCAHPSSAPAPTALRHGTPFSASPAHHPSSLSSWADFSPCLCPLDPSRLRSSDLRGHDGWKTTRCCR